MKNTTRFTINYVPFRDPEKVTTTRIFCSEPLGRVTSYYSIASEWFAHTYVLYQLLLIAGV